ncbi:MAG: hypothetical protein AAFO94_20550 [Bacteroidota bacterium]
MRIFILLSFIAIVACQNDTSNAATEKQSQYHTMARELCMCWQPKVAFAEKAAGLIAKKDKEAFLKLEEEAEDIDNDLDDCIEKLEKKFPAMPDEREEVKLMTAMKKICPAVTDMIDSEAAELE